MNNLIEENGKYYNKCQVHLLDIKEDNIINPIVLNPSTNKLQIGTKGFSSKDYKEIGAYPKHLYITPDEEIKEDDWIYDSKLNIVIQHKSYKDGCKKIIATTDNSLTFENYSVSAGKYNEPLPQLSKQFIQKYIEEYNKGSIINNILVEYLSERKWITEYVDTSSYIEYTLKTDSHNCISIKSIKDSYTREEVTNLFKKFLIDYHNSNETFLWKVKTDKWIEENI